MNKLNWIKRYKKSLCKKIMQKLKEILKYSVFDGEKKTINWVNFNSFIILRILNVKVIEQIIIELNWRQNDPIRKDNY